MSHTQSATPTRVRAVRDAHRVALSFSEAPPYEITGPANAPVVVALGGISADRHVTSTTADTSPGWWENTVGAGRAIDTRIYRVLSFNYLDGGGTAPGHPATLVSTHDQADALSRVLDLLGVEQVHCIVGASYGGMVALAFADRYPHRVARLVVISAAHKAHPMSTALRAIQRGIVTLGLETDRAHDAVALARALAMTTYRSAAEFADRFDSAPEAVGVSSATFPVESYLRHHGDRFARHWCASRFLALSLSADLHRVEPQRINTATVLVSIEGDTVIPPAQMEQLAAQLAGPHQLIHLHARTGHDAFLAEPAIIGPIVRQSLNAGEIQ